MKILSINEPILVMINHVECLLELLYLVLVKHSKHIAGCSLGSLLGGSFTASSLAGGHCGMETELKIVCICENQREYKGFQVHWTLWLKLKLETRLRTKITDQC